MEVQNIKEWKKVIDKEWKKCANFHFPILHAKAEFSHMKYHREIICPAILS